MSTLNKPCNWLLCTTLVKPKITSPVGKTLCKTDVVMGNTRILHKFNLQVMSENFCVYG